MKKTSKRFNAVLEKVDAEKEYEPSEALNIVKLEKKILLEVVMNQLIQLKNH